MKSRADDGTSEPRKLTLRIDNALINRAKRYAHKRGTSLSQMIADYFRAITAGKADQEQDWKQKLPPTTRSLLGMAGKGELDEDDYHRYLAEKHR